MLAVVVGTGGDLQREPRTRIKGNDTGRFQPDCNGTEARVRCHDFVQGSVCVAEKRERVAVDAEIKAEFKSLNEKLDSALTTLYGCEESGQPGLRIRVDRIEQERRFIKVVLGWIGGILTVVVGERIKSYFTGNH